MTRLKPGRVAELAGVSVDTVRRWTDEGRLPSRRTAGGQRVIEGAELALFLVESAESTEGPSADTVVARSARNRFAGIVTRVQRDGVTAQVDIQCGPHRVVSLMTREAVEELGLEAGVLAVASVKSTTVVVELPGPR